MQKIQEDTFFYIFGKFQHNFLFKSSFEIPTSAQLKVLSVLKIFSSLSLNFVYMHIHGDFFDFRLIIIIKIHKNGYTMAIDAYGSPSYTYKDKP